MTATMPAEPTLKQLHGRAFASLYDEMDYQVSRVDGTLPPDLTGTLFRIGPGKFEVGEVVRDGKAASIRVATDNGDNARLQITAARVVYPVVRLMFRVPDTTPVQICYGNRRAPYTRYDLQLVRPEFEKATQIAATLGEEEKLPGYEADPSGGTGKGGPWLWAALALVVGALLWVVAKMLPGKVE